MFVDHAMTHRCHEADILCFTDVRKAQSQTVLQVAKLAECFDREIIVRCRPANFGKQMSSYNVAMQTLLENNNAAGLAAHPGTELARSFANDLVRYVF